MSIRLNDLSKIATIIKTKYGCNLYEMNFIFCFKKHSNSYYIFQEIQGMPIKRIVYHESNNSVTFVASWASWSNPFAMVADANYDQIESWKDLQDRGRPLNSYINIKGGFNNNDWVSANKQNKKEKKKRHKNKSDTFVEFRIDKIQRANFNKWGFELYSPTISMIGFESIRTFPYQINGIENYNTSVINPRPHPHPDSNFHYGFNQQDEDSIFIHKVSWQGGSFNIPEFHNSSEVVQVSNLQGGHGSMCDLSSYWDINETSEENNTLDEEIANLFLDNKEKEEKILDVGQRKIDLDFRD